MKNIVLFYYYQGDGINSLQHFMGLDIKPNFDDFK